MNLHVVANLDRTILRAHSPARRLRALKAHLDACPGFVLTLFTSQPFLRVKNLFLDGLGGQPRHVVTDDGDSIFHQGLFGEWDWDSAYPDWLTFNRQLIRKTPGTAREASGVDSDPGNNSVAIALDFIEIFSATPRPVAVFGDPNRDIQLLQGAELPVPLGIGRPAEASLVISAALGLSGSHPAIQRLVDLLGNPAGRSASPRPLELNPVQYRERVVS